MEPLLHGAEAGGDKDKEKKNTQPSILDYREYHTDTTVRFVVKMTPDQFKANEKIGFHKFFKLQKPLSLNSMVLFDRNGCLKRYDNIDEILKEFYNVRIDLYKKRKAYMEGMLGAESLKLDNIARFILEKIDGKVKVENLKKIDICKILKDRKYDPDPVLRWKESIARDGSFELNDPAPVNEEEENQDVQSKTTKEYDYLLGMPIWNLTMEKKDELLRQQKNKNEELAKLKVKTPSDLWIDDLDQFLMELDKYETKEKEEESVSQLKAYKASLISNKANSKAMIVKKTQRLEYLPTQDAEIIEVKIDPSLIEKANKEKDSTCGFRIKKEEKKEMNLIDIINSKKDEIDENKLNELIEKLSKPISKVAASKTESKEKISFKKTTKVKDEENSDKEQAITTSPLISSKTKKKTESKSSKKNTTDKDSKSIKSYFKTKDNSSSDTEMTIELTDENTNSTNNEPIERKVLSRTRKPVQYDVSSSDDEALKKQSKKRIESDSDDDILMDNYNDAFSENESTKSSERSAPKKFKLIDNNDENQKFSKKTDSKKIESKGLYKINSKTDVKIKIDEPIKINEKKKEFKSTLKNPNKLESDHEEIENKSQVEIIKKNRPVNSKSTGNILKFFKPTNNKSKYNDSDSENDIIDDDSKDEDFDIPKAKPKNQPKQRKLLSKIDTNNLGKKGNNAANMLHDNDLFEVDSD